MDGKNRKDITIGAEVEIVQKHHQRTGELTEGFVQRILTLPIHTLLGSSRGSDLLQYL